MKRAIITIDEAKCDGCGQCIGACHEGALALVDGKARLVSDVYCDGLGACLGECPQGAITVEEREAPAFDQAAVDLHLKQQPAHACPGHGHGHHHEHGHHHAQGHACPGSALRQKAATAPTSPAAPTSDAGPSQLTTWPLQLRLVPPSAPWLAGADLLVCADCVPFAVPDFHQRYLAGKVVLIGCPKLDDNQFNLEKLAAIYHIAAPKSITVLRMSVPCCGGLAQAAILAQQLAGTAIPLEVVTISPGL